MKFRVMFKTPDAVDDAIRDLPEEEEEAAREVSELFVRYGELVTVEFDTAKQTATVVRQ